VVTTAAGAGVAGGISMVVRGLTSTVSVAALTPFAYAPPTLSGLVAGSVLPTLGFIVEAVASNVTLVGANFGAPGTPLLVTYQSGAGARRCGACHPLPYERARSDWPRVSNFVAFQGCH
jgi:hypothetical protein